MSLVDSQCESLSGDESTILVGESPPVSDTNKDSNPRKRDSPAKHWCFTHFYQGEVPNLALLWQKNCGALDYLVAGKEVCPTTGRNHLQGFLSFRQKKRRSGVWALFPKCHCQNKSGRSTVQQAIDYCKKDDTFWEFGVPPKENTENAGVARTAKYDGALTLARLGRLSEIDSGMQIRHYANLRSIARDAMPDPGSLPGVCGVWIWGASGCGKTQLVVNRWPSRFPHLMNKWWDGYQNQDVVVLEDMDISHEHMGYHLKLWADSTSFLGEIKGSAVRIRPKLLVVTSQHEMSEIWVEPKLLEALSRRFTVVDFSNKMYVEAKLDGIAQRIPAAAKERRETISTPDVEVTDLTGQDDDLDYLLNLDVSLPGPPPELMDIDMESDAGSGVANDQVLDWLHRRNVAILDLE